MRCDQQPLPGSRSSVGRETRRQSSVEGSPPTHDRSGSPIGKLEITDSELGKIAFDAACWIAGND
jgi:hypothetical protein